MPAAAGGLDIQRRPLSDPRHRGYPPGGSSHLAHPAWRPHHPRHQVCCPCCDPADVSCHQQRFHDPASRLDTLPPAGCPGVTGALGGVCSHGLGARGVAAGKPTSRQPSHIVQRCIPIITNLLSTWHTSGQPPIAPLPFSAIMLSPCVGTTHCRSTAAHLAASEVPTKHACKNRGLLQAKTDSMQCMSR